MAINKKLFLIISIIINFSMCFAAEKKQNPEDIKSITSNYSSDKTFYVVYARENGLSGDNIFTLIPEAPEGYHLISIETYIIMEGRDHIKRVYIFTNKNEITSFSVSSAIQTENE